MKTIEITSGDQKVQFTTKSVTFDGKEFLYAHMTNVIHSTERHIYTFTYDGEVKLLPYDEKDEKTLNAIFSQVQKLTAQKKATVTAAAEGEKASESEAVAKTEDKNEAVKTETGSQNDIPKDGNAENVEKSPEKSSDSSDNKAPSQKADGASGAQDKESPEEPAVKVSDVFGKFKSKRSVKKTDAAKTEKTGSETDKTEKPEDKPAENQEKIARRNKSLKIFGIIIAILLVCSVAYYFIFGTPSDPTQSNPNNTETQMYEDIDDLINELQ